MDLLALGIRLQGINKDCLVFIVKLKSIDFTHNMDLHILKHILK